MATGIAPGLKDKLKQASQNVLNNRQPSVAPKMTSQVFNKGIDAPAVISKLPNMMGSTPQKTNFGAAAAPKTTPMWQALDKFKNATKIQTPTPSPVNTFKPPVNRLENTLGTMSDLTNAQPFEFKAPQQFSYNPETDAAFQSYMQQAKRNLTDTQANTNAHLRATGQGKSSYSETVAQQQGNRAAADIEDAMITQYLPQAFQQYTDAANRDFQTQQSNYGVGQDRLQNFGNLYANQYQQDVTKPQSEAALTGTLNDPQMQGLYDTVLQAKQQYAAAKTPQERETARRAAESARAMITRLGGNADLVGSDVNLDTAAGNRNQFGIRTLAGQGEDRQVRQQNVDFAKGVSDQTGKVIQPQKDVSGLYRQAFNPNTPFTQSGAMNNQSMKLNDQSIDMNDQTLASTKLDDAWKTAQNLGYVTKELSALTGIPEGTDTLDAIQTYSGIQQANDANDLAWISEEYDQSNPSGGSSSYEPPAYKGMSAKDVTANIYKQLFDEDGDPIAGAPNTPDAIWQMVVGYGLPDGQDDQVMLSLGMKPDQIAAMDKKYGGGK